MSSSRPKRQAVINTEARAKAERDAETARETELYHRFKETKRDKLFSDITRKQRKEVIKSIPSLTAAELGPDSSKHNQTPFIASLYLMAPPQGEKQHYENGMRIFHNDIPMAFLKSGKNIHINQKYHDHNNEEVTALDIVIDLLNKNPRNPALEELFHKIMEEGGKRANPSSGASAKSSRATGRGFRKSRKMRKTRRHRKSRRY